MKKNKNHKDSKIESIKHTNENNVSVKNYFWQITSFVLLVLLIIAFVFAISSAKGNATDINTEDAEFIGEETKDFLINTFSLPEANLKSTVIENNLYLHTFEIEGKDFNIHTSLDGEIVFVPGIEPLYKSKMDSLDVDPQENTETENIELEKTDKPIVELFIMSHCPFGTQIEKGILPVVDVLEDTIDFEIKFVNYIMHDLMEIEEQVLQYCIQKDSKEDFKEYLYCFLEDGNTERCLDQTNLNLDTYTQCIENTDTQYSISEMYDDKSQWLSGKYPKFLIHDSDNISYGVKGSPTLVINGSVVNSSRDSQSLLNAICEAFETKPRACNTELSSANPQPGFGFQTTTTNTTATCG
jgi:hypothetical protein